MRKRSVLAFVLAVILALSPMSGMSMRASAADTSSALTAARFWRRNLYANKVMLFAF